ncbi:hypothetical protein D3C83_211800 [compost metagenome]
MRRSGRAEVRVAISIVKASGTAQIRVPRPTISSRPPKNSTPPTNQALKAGIEMPRLVKNSTTPAWFLNSLP